ncbi:MAG: response regulator [Leptospiraceae bacterium]
MNFPSRPLRKILPVQIVRLLPYFLALGLALLHLLVWIRFQGLEDAKHQKELQKVATDISRHAQRRVDFYSSELLALESLYKASDLVTLADWKSFLKTMRADQDPIIMDLAVGRVTPTGRFIPQYSKSQSSQWETGRNTYKVLRDREEVFAESYTPPVILKEIGDGYQFQMFRLMDARTMQVAAIRLNGALLFQELKTEFPEGISVEVFLPAPESALLLGPPGTGTRPNWSPVTPELEAKGDTILFHGPYFRYNIHASDRFFELYSGADQGLFRFFFVFGGLGLSVLIALLFWQQARTRSRAVDLARSMARAFRISRSRQAQVFRKNKAVQLLLEPATGRIIDANEAAIQFYGYEREELLKKTVIDINTATREEILAAMERARTAGQSHFDFRHQLKNGEIRDVEVYSGPLDFQGKTFLYSIVHDVTVRKQLEKELIQAKESALAASHAKSAFLANMSHEIRTPMYSLMGMAELMKETTLEPDQTEYLDIIEKSSRALLEVIDNVLDVSRIESGTMVLDNAPFNPNRILENVLAIMEPVARQKELTLQVESGLDPDLILSGDAFRMQQVLLNLVGNSIKFTSSGEILILADSLASHPLTGDGDSPPTLEVIRIGVKDSGRGITREEMEHIFDAFYQADMPVRKRPGGSGLGLSISKKIVELMGSSLRVISQPGEGSHFFFTVQLPTTQAREQRKETRDEVPLEPGKARILIVEDNQDNQMLINKMLGKGPYKLDSAWNGKEAVRKTANQDFDLILMDLQMPELDGLSACKLIKRRYARRPSYQSRVCPPVVALTASSLEEDKQEAFEAGMVRFVSKPVTPSELRRLVQETINGSHRMPPDSGGPVLKPESMK